MKTAAELMAELQRDSDFVKRSGEADRRLSKREEEYAQLWSPYMRTLNLLGFAGTSPQEIVENYSPLPNSAIEIFLSALLQFQDTRLKESAVRVLAAAKYPFDGRPLVMCFEETDDEGLRWAILSTIAIVRPNSIESWLMSVRETPIGETLRKLSAST